MAVTTPLVNALVTAEGQVGEGSEDTTSPSSRTTTPPAVLLEKQTSADNDQFASSTEEEEEERVLRARPRPSPPVNEGHVITTTSGVERFQASRRDSSFNGNVCFRQWSVRTVVGDLLYPGTPAIPCGTEMSSHDFFLLMFPPKEVRDIVRLTNQQLHLKS